MKFNRICTVCGIEYIGGNTSINIRPLTAKQNVLDGTRKLRHKNKDGE